jgi:hypothetical protein
MSNDVHLTPGQEEVLNLSDPQECKETRLWYSEEG